MIDLMHHAARASLAATLLTVPALACGAVLHGLVTGADGVPIAGAIVTLGSADGHSDSAYTDADGRWHLVTDTLSGQLQLRARAPGYADATRPLTLAADDEREESLALQAAASPAAASAALTASTHAATIPWTDDALRDGFISQCMFCHQIGNDWTRKDADETYWRQVIRRMEGYGSVITGRESEAFRDTLARSFKQPVTHAVRGATPHEGLAGVRYREWSFGAGMNYVHDIELGADGRFYGVDMGADLVWIVDPRSNAVESIPFPESDLPLGGMFSGGVAPLGTFAARHGPHSIVAGPDGRMYMTCSLAGEICIFDPRTRAFEFHPVGADGIYPHTLRFDAEGVLWFTMALSNQIGRMDVASGEIRLLDLPSNGFWRWLTDALLPAILKVSAWVGKRDLYVHLSHHKLSGEGHRIFNLPYGLDIDPVDGSVWYSKLYADRIGRVDPRTLEIEEFATPHGGPRRMRFAPDGTLWIPSFNEGVLMRFDPRARQFTGAFPLPTLNPGEFETPYALNVHPRTGDVWITGNLSDRMLRFVPSSGRFLEYPSPTRTMFARDVIFTGDGSVCTSNSNLPAAAIEGGRPKLLCIEPGS